MHAGRFELVRELGSGGMGVVYEAVDRQRKLRVALKRMKRANAAGLFQFKREFRALARIVHPNLVRLFELVAEGDQWFFTMELIDGVDFRRHVRPDLRSSRSARPAAGLGEAGDVRTHTVLTGASAGRPAETAYRTAFTAETMDSNTQDSFSSISGSAAIWDQVLDRDECSPANETDRLRAALAQLAEGVFALHQRGLLHRDIKPLNVLVEPGGRVVLLDFGLVTALRSSGGVEFGGTPSYMAPEQFAHDYSPGPAADWYAVGMMLYEALTGLRPRARNMSEMAVVKQSGPPPSPGDLGVAAPADLEHLCMALLHLDPTRRPDGKSVLAALGARRATGSRRRARVTSSPTSLFGCDTQFQVLRDAFERSQSGAGNTVYVQGPSGTGKTALVDAFIDAVVRDVGAVVLRGRCYERESVPYKAVDSLIDSLSEHLLRQPLAAGEYPADLDALVAVFPVLRRVDVLAEVPEIQRSEVDAYDVRRRAFAALRDLFAALARDRPVVLFIDDLQWGDLDSAPLLDQLMRPPEAPPLLLLASYRSEEVERSQLLAALLRRGQRLGPAAAVQSVAVGALSPVAAAGLARSLLPGADGDTIDAVVRESEGHPYFLRELCRASRDGDDGASAPVRVELEAVLADRIGRLEASARRVLLTTALCGRPTAVDTVLEASGEAGREHDIVPLLEEEQLVRVATVAGGSVVECFHDRVRETVAARADAEQARELHRALAEVFADRGADSETLARHYHHGGDANRAARHALDAAAQAEEMLAFGRAAELYRLALDGDCDDDTRLALRRTLGDALVRAGRGAEAAVVYGELADSIATRAGDGDAARAFELRRLAAFEYLKTGRLDLGMSEIARLLDEVGLTMPATPRRALPRLALRRAQVWLRGTSFSPRAASAAGDRLTQVADVCWSVGVGLGMVDTFRAAYFQTRGLLLALRTGDPYRVARALCLESAILAVGSHRDRRRAYRLLDRAEHLAGALERPELRAWVAGARSFVHHQGGRFLDGRNAAASSLHILREECPGLTWEAMSVDLYLLWALYGLGDIRAMTSRVSVLIEHANERGDLYSLANLRTGLCSSVWLAADAPGEARAGAENAVDSWTHQHGFHLQHYWAMFALAQCDLYEGRVEDAERRIRSQWTAFRRSLLLGMKAVHIEAHDLRARVCVAVAARAPRSGAARRALRDARVLERSGLAWGQGVGALVRAGVAAATGRPNAAELYDRAGAACRAADMELYAQAAAYRAAEQRRDDPGRVAAGDWFRRQGVVDPERFIDVFAPAPTPPAALPSPQRR